MPLYYQNVLSKYALVRIDNQRFLDFCSGHGMNVQLLRVTDATLHAKMTGALRRAVTSFLLPCFPGLKHNSWPHEDIKLNAWLLVNKLQILMRGINLPYANRFRTRSDIYHIQSVEFELGRVTCEEIQILV